MEVDLRRLNAYELPKQLVSLGIDGRLSLKTAGQAAREAMGGDPLLSLAERTRMSQHLQRAIGIDKGPVTDTLLEIATNPLTYLMFVPELGAAAKISLGAPKFSAWLREHPGILEVLGLVPGLAMFRGTSTTPIVGAVVDSMERTANSSREKIAPAVAKVLKKTGQKSLSIGMRGPGDPGFESRKRLDMLLQIRLEKLNHDVVEKVPYKVVKEEGGKARFLFKEKTRKKLIDVTDEEVDALLRDEFDALDLLDAIRKDQSALRDAVFGTTPEQIKRNAGRMYFSMRGVKNSEAYQHTDFGRGVLQSLFGPRMERAVFQGKKIRVPVVDESGKLVRVGKKVKKVDSEISLEEFEEMVLDFVQTTTRKDGYMPRNIYTTRDGTGQLVSPKSGKLATKGLIPGSSTIPRGGTGAPLDVDDLDGLQALQDSLRGTKYQTATMRAERARSLDYEKVSVNGTQEYNVRRRINALDGHERYVRSMVTTKAFFVDDISEEVLELEAMALKRASEEIARQGDKAKGFVQGELRSVGTPKGSGVSLDTPLKDVPDHLKPYGGYTYADALDRSYRLMKNESARDLLREAIIPRITGDATAKHATTNAFLNHVKSMAKWFVESEPGKVLQKNQIFKPAYDAIEAISKAEMPAYVGGSYQTKLTAYLYGTHLGLNFKSIIFNLTQPFVTMTRYAKISDVAEGYAAALDQLGSYYKEVIEMGGTKAAFNRDTTRELLKKHIRLANVDGRDMLGVTEDLLNQLDIGIAHNSDILSNGRMSFIQKILWPFQQGELLNRVAAGEIAARRVARQGLDVASKDVAKRALAKAEIEQLVQETQFGASLLNTMGAAYGVGRLSFLESPVLRQFLTFPVRMATMPFATDARLDNAGLLRSLQLGLRSVGFSAVGYELLKGTVNVDASDYLTIAGSTQLLSGALDDRDGPFPVPPAIGITTNVARGLLTGDKAMLANELYRTIPAGIALGRGIKSLDPFGVLGNPAGTSEFFSPYNQVLWNKPNPDGTVPVLDRNGRLIANQRPSELVLRSLGLDFNKYQSQAEIDDFLVKQRDQMVQYEQKIIQAFLNNDQDKLLRLAAEFEKKYGFRPGIDRSQIQNALRNRQVDRSSRIIGRIDPVLRGAYAQATDSDAPTPPTDELRGEAAVAARTLQMLIGAPQ